ncbi:MAG: DUF3006 domain-containing protein [Clostridia bacterium]|nr:DUF3006 domain-containing protein [Clostridia bacterium]
MIILERYEGNIAVLEIDGKIKNVPAKMLKENIKEGTVLVFEDNMYLPDSEATAVRRKKIASLQEDLFG